MPEPTLPPEAVRDASCDLAALSQDWNGYAWPAELTDKIVHTVWAALLPHLGLPQRRPRIVCPVCTRAVVKRDDDTPRSHDVPVERRDLMCEDTFGRCRGGCRCRKCRPQRKEMPNA